MILLNKLTEEQMNEAGIDPVEAQEVLEWYYNFGEEIFDKDDPKITSQVDTIAILEMNGESPYVIFRVLLNGQNHRQLQNSYDAALKVIRDQAKVGGYADES